MPRLSLDTLKTKSTISSGGVSYSYYDIQKAAKKLGADFTRLPFSLKVLLENLLRHEDGKTVTQEHISAFSQWLDQKRSLQEISYRPARVLMQDFTGVPAVVDLAAMRDAVSKLGGDPSKINPTIPVDLVIDHSVQVDHYGTSSSLAQNVALEMERNKERYQFLRWGQQAFDNFRVVPPGTGICHQVNLEHLSQCVWTNDIDGETFAYPDTLVGTDSHTTMVNGLAVLGWGVGGIEAESAMLGQPISMMIPEVIGFEITGKLKEGVTATDLVLTVTQMLREKGVVGKFVEFYGAGLKYISVADRSTISNMAPEYGATCGFFPIDDETLSYLRLTGRGDARVDLVEAYAKAQGMWRKDRMKEPVFSETMSLDISTVEPCLAGPRRPQDKVLLADLHHSFEKELPSFKSPSSATGRVPVKGKDYDMGSGDVAIAAITSCTNTSNPSVMLAAGLVAKKALERGITVKPWVKTSLAPGSKVVTEYLEASGLQDPLNQIGFNAVGYGCTTCIGNSGPLKPEIEKTVKDSQLVVASVLSGNRNFEGRVHPLVQANYLASPPLVVMYALAGTVQIDVMNDPIATAKDGKPVYFKDLWPSHEEIKEAMEQSVTSEMFAREYADVFSGDDEWKSLEVPSTKTYDWPESSYIKKPLFFDGMTQTLPPIGDIKNARLLALLGDSITTDHISPAGSIAADSPAARYLQSRGVSPKDFNSYGARRGNHEVMMRGTFANVRIKNDWAPGTTGGYTTYNAPWVKRPSWNLSLVNSAKYLLHSIGRSIGVLPKLSYKPARKGEVSSIYDAAMTYQADNVPLIIMAGKDYGMGSSRDWAAKGTLLLGVKAVVAESFERIHRSNLIGMGILPLVFEEGFSRSILKLMGDEAFHILDLKDEVGVHQRCRMIVRYSDGSEVVVRLLMRLDTEEEVDSYYHGGILHKAIRQIASE